MGPPTLSSPPFTVCQLTGTSAPRGETITSPIEWGWAQLQTCSNDRQEVTVTFSGLICQTGLQHLTPGAENLQ